MDQVRKFILDTARDRGIELKELSLQLGKNHAYMHQFINRGVPKKLNGDDRALLSQILRVPEIALGAPVSLARKPPLQYNQSNATLTDPPGEVGPMIPLYGTVVGGVDGQFELNGNVLDRVRAPASLWKSEEAYAVRVSGDSMEPRYEDGETIYVDPKRRPSKNDYVVAQIKRSDSPVVDAYVKKFVRWNSDRLVLCQFNPEKELDFDSELVVSVHYVLRSGE